MKPSCLRNETVKLECVEMDEASSATDISSSLSEFVRKEKLLKELYQENPKSGKPVEVERLKYNDGEIDSILQQMGKLLSPDGEDTDNSVYKHVMEEADNKSIEQILNEAKELVRESTPVYENISPGFSTDDLSSEYTENEITFINIKNTTDEEIDFNGNNFTDNTDNGIKTKLNNVNKLNNYANTNKGRSFIPVKNLSDSKKKTLNILQNLTVSKNRKNKNENSNDEIQFLKQEVDRFNHLYVASKEECSNLKNELSALQVNLW